MCQNSSLELPALRAPVIHVFSPFRRNRYSQPMLHSHESNPLCYLEFRFQLKYPRSVSSRSKAVPSLLKTQDPSGTELLSSSLRVRLVDHSLRQLYQRIDSTENGEASVGLFLPFQVASEFPLGLQCGFLILGLRYSVTSRLLLPARHPCGSREQTRGVLRLQHSWTVSDIITGYSRSQNSVHTFAVLCSTSMVILK